MPHAAPSSSVTGREPHFREVTLGGVGEIGEVEDVVGHVLLTAANPPGVDGDVLPSLGVDDEDAAWANDDEVDLGAPAAGPATVGEQVVANGGEQCEDFDGLPLGDLSDGVAAGGGARLGRGAFVLVGERKLAARFGTGGVSCGHG